MLLNPQERPSMSKQTSHLLQLCLRLVTHPRWGHDRCPMCRADGLYAKNTEINDRLARKRVKCSGHEGCNWRGCLRDYDDHEHRRYAPSEISTGLELPAIAAGPKGVGVSTSELLRNLNNAPPMDGSVAPATPTPTAAPAAAPVAPRATNTNGNASRGSASAARRQSGAEATSTATARRGSRRESLTAASGQAGRGGAGLNSRPGMIPRPPATPRPQNARTAVRTGSNTVARRGSNAPRAAPPAPAPAPAPPAPQQPAPHPAPVAEPEPAPVPISTTASGDAASVPTASVLETPAAAPSASNPTSEPSNAATATATATGDSPTTGQNGDATTVDGLQYRRLANPTPRPNAMTNRLAQGRDQLFILMTLMSYELEERRRAIEQFQSMTAERERVRLQQLSEVQTLNRRLTLVTNNLSRLLDSRVVPPQVSSQTLTSIRPMGLGRVRLEDSSSEDSDDLFP